MAEQTKCQGCECKVPVRNGYHEEPYECPEHEDCEQHGEGLVYAYPCTRMPEVTRG